VEEEIQTLSQVLAAKEKHLAELKRKLGISSLQEFKQNIAKGWQDVTATNAYVPPIVTLLGGRKGFVVLSLGRGEGCFCAFSVAHTAFSFQFFQSTRLVSNFGFPEHSKE
jgi:hypothetical protein